MKKSLKVPAGKSVVSHLTDLLRMAFPQTTNTGKNSDMALIKPDPLSHGKAVRFYWNKLEYRLTANLKIQHYVFGFLAPNSLKETTETTRMESVLASFLPKEEVVVNPIMETPRLLLPSHVE